MDALNLPADTKLAATLVEGHVRKEQTIVDRGSVGGFFGSKDSVPANVAALIALATSAFFIIAVVFWAGKTEFTYKESAAALSSLITLTLGFLFGRASKE